MAAIGGIFCLIPTYELLIKPGVPVLTWGMIPFWFIAPGAMSIALPLLIAAASGISRTVVLDPAARRMSVSASGNFGIRWSRGYSFRDLAPPSVFADDDDSESRPVYRVEVRAAGRKRPIEIDRFPDKASASACAARIAASLQQPAAP